MPEIAGHHANRSAILLPFLCDLVDVYGSNDLLLGHRSRRLLLKKLLDLHDFVDHCLFAAFWSQDSPGRPTEAAFCFIIDFKLLFPERILVLCCNRSLTRELHRLRIVRIPHRRTARWNVGIVPVDHFRRCDASVDLHQPGLLDRSVVRCFRWLVAYARHIL